jgi:hypothetical protein
MNKTYNKYWKLILALLLVSFICVGCGGDDGGPTSPTVNTLLGTWSGTWTSFTGVTGTVVVNITGGDSTTGTISGTLTFTANPCYTDTTIAGMLTGSTVTIDTSVAGEVVIQQSGTLSNNNTQMAGNYTVTGAGLCQGDVGSWTVTKQ